MTEPLLLAECVSKRFDGRSVLSAGSLRAVPRQVRALLGRNGAGKSTLLKIAAGLLAADGGVVMWDGRALERPALAGMARRGMFFLPDRDLLTGRLCVRAQLEMFRRQFDGADVSAAARRVGILHVLDASPARLSSGERRRAELACVLVRRPRCLLADEPYRGLSPRDAEVVTEVLREVAALGSAVVFTGHEVTTFLDQTDHVTWCTSGTTYELGPPAVASTDPRFKVQFLGSDAKA
jgi:ABC-type multidrug transport system ATPase subunit